MISDNDLYRLAIFLGSCAMMMIVLYHFLDVNARDDEETTVAKPVGNDESSVPSDNASGSTTKAQ
ncbi:hypothetical protein N7451_005804 [Penicillium sp. IBT 35674x]|nr:hypothetical protein N7451_005804 [Penicillium sp. IBT 35674x]